VSEPAWSRIKDSEMTNQAQIDALEHLLIAVLSNQINTSARRCQPLAFCPAVLNRSEFGMTGSSVIRSA